MDYRVHVGPVVREADEIIDQSSGRPSGYLCGHTRSQVPLIYSAPTGGGERRELRPGRSRDPFRYTKNPLQPTQGHRPTPLAPAAAGLSTGPDTATTVFGIQNHTTKPSVCGTGLMQ